MEVDETIQRWFEETVNALEGPYEGKDLLIHGWCLSSVKLALNYFESTLILLNNKRRLPAKALLRTLGEFIVKVVWCLRGENKSENELRNRFDKWRKSTLIEHRRVRKKALEINTYTKEQRAQLEELIAKDNEEIDKIKLSELPSIADLFEGIFAPLDWVAAQGGMYLQFLRAIHLDMIALEMTMDLQKLPEGQITCLGDTKDNIETLKALCLAHTYIFLTEVRSHYGLDVSSMKSDYEKLL